MLQHVLSERKCLKRPFFTMKALKCVNQPEHLCLGHTIHALYCRIWTDHMVVTFKNYLIEKTDSFNSVQFYLVLKSVNRFLGPNFHFKLFYISPVKIRSVLMLNKSNSHCYLCYRKHNPTIDINTFNATALLIFRLIPSILYTISIH